MHPLTLPSVPIPHVPAWAPRFVLSPEGAFFRDFLMDELVKSIDALSRDQLRALLSTLGLQNAALPVLIPGANRWAPGRAGPPVIARVQMPVPACAVAEPAPCCAFAGTKQPASPGARSQPQPASSAAPNFLAALLPSSSTHPTLAPQAVPACGAAPF